LSKRQVGFKDRLGGHAYYQIWAAPKEFGILDQRSYAEVSLTFGHEENTFVSTVQVNFSEAGESLTSWVSWEVSTLTNPTIQRATQSPYPWQTFRQIIILEDFFSPRTVCTGSPLRTQLSYSKQFIRMSLWGTYLVILDINNMLPLSQFRP
jgi:hypothetical protein